MTKPIIKTNSSFESELSGETIIKFKVKKMENQLTFGLAHFTSVKTTALAQAVWTDTTVLALGFTSLRNKVMEFLNDDVSALHYGPVFTFIFKLEDSTPLINELLWENNFSWFVAWNSSTAELIFGLADGCKWLETKTVIAQSYWALSGLTSSLDSPLEEVSRSLHNHWVSFEVTVVSCTVFPKVWVAWLGNVSKGSSLWFQKLDDLKCNKTNECD